MPSSQGIRRTYMEWVYLVKSGEAVKVGRTRELAKRLETLQTGSPEPLVILRGYRMAAAWAPEAEQSIRDNMSRPIRGEWVSWQPGMERIADGIAMRFLR